MGEETLAKETVIGYLIQKLSGSPSELLKFDKFLESFVSEFVTARYRGTTEKKESEK